MIYCLVGHSASGKTTIERRLENMGISRIISYTTRPPRENEHDGVDYFFIDEKDFDCLDNGEFFTETAEYREWKYGLSISGYTYTEKDYVAVVTPHGYNEIVKAVGKEWVKSFFIQVPERERMIRLCQRGDDVDEIIRRILADREDFKDFEYEADYVVNNKNIDESVDLIYNIVRVVNA